MLINLFNIKMPDLNELDEVVNEKFISRSKFSSDIEDFVKSHSLTYIDAIVEYCEKNNIDIDNVNKLISKPLKEKLRYEATELNYLKKTSHAKLPL